jgi:hypothetical protein
MSGESDSVAELKRRLRVADEEFERQMLARGFDPAQAETVALPTVLAKLYMERDLLRSELQELCEQQDDE